MTQVIARGGSPLRRLDDCGEGPFCAMAILRGGDHAVPPVVCAHFTGQPAKGLCFVYRDRIWRLMERRLSKQHRPEGTDLLWEARPVER